jgi:hypothetical protein
MNEVLSFLIGLFETALVEVCFRQASSREKS